MGAALPDVTLALTLNKAGFYLFYLLDGETVYKAPGEEMTGAGVLGRLGLFNSEVAMFGYLATRSSTGVTLTTPLSLFCSCFAAFW